MGDWRFEYRYRNVPMLELVVQAEGRPAVKLDGVVDGGQPTPSCLSQTRSCSA